MGLNQSCDRNSELLAISIKHSGYVVSLFLNIKGQGCFVFRPFLFQRFQEMKEIIADVRGMGGKQ